MKKDKSHSAAKIHAESGGTESDGAKVDEAKINEAYNKYLVLTGEPERLLYQEQLYYIKEILEGHDIFAVLPTGYGKSAIYQQREAEYFETGHNSNKSGHKNIWRRERLFRLHLVIFAPGSLEDRF